MSMTTDTTKITRRRKPELHERGKVKRTGPIYYEVAYFTGHWHYKEFDTLQQAKEFAKNY